MKKALYGTTALLAAGMMSGQALAVGTPMTSTNFNLTLGGFATFKFEYQSMTPSQNITVLDADGTLADEPRKYDFEFDAELYFQGANKMPNGTTVGFRFELETGGAELQKAAGKQASGIDATGAASCTSSAAAGTANGTSGGTQCGNNRNDYIDDNYIYLDGRWGKLTLGGTRDERLEIGIARTYSAPGAIQIDTDVDAVAGNNRVQSGSFTGQIDLNTQPNKAIWVLPAMGGFRVALNWSPDVSMENSTTVTQSDDQGAAGEYWHLATQWAGTVAGVGTRLSFAYFTQKAEDNRPNSLVNNGLNGAAGTSIASNNRWRVGADFKTGPITIGGYWSHLVQNAASTNPEEGATRYGIGATYSVGVWGFGAAYEAANQEVAQRNLVGAANFGDILGKDSGTRWDAALTYAGLGGGKTVTFGYRIDNFTAIGDGLRDSSTTTGAGTADLKVDNESKNKTIALKLDWVVGPGFTQTFGLENYNYTHHSGLAGAPARKTSNALLASTQLTF